MKKIITHNNETFIELDRWRYNVSFPPDQRIIDDYVKYLNATKVLVQQISEEEFEIIFLEEIEDAVEISEEIIPIKKKRGRPKK